MDDMGMGDDGDAGQPISEDDGGMMDETMDGGTPSESDSGSGDESSAGSDKDEAQGCACDTSGQNNPSGILLIGAVLFGIRRRWLRRV